MKQDPVDCQLSATLRLRGPEDFRTMPWRNGGGITTELAIAPEGATVADPFAWRLSTALVSSSGPFSRFAGCDRTLLLLEGDGIELDHALHGHVSLERSLASVRFSGDWNTTGTLRGGPCRDFNVITRRNAWRHDLSVFQGGMSVALPVADLLLAFAVRGSFSVDALDYVLPEGHLLEARTPIILNPASDEAVLLVVGLMRLAWSDAMIEQSVT